MAQAAIPLMVVGTLVSAGGTIAGGKSAEQYGQTQQTAANYSAGVSEYQAGVNERTAGQLDQNAGQERAVSQRVAAEERRKARLVASRAQAVGAAGGGAEDAEKVIADLEGEGTYRSLTALFTGESSARDLEAAAADKRSEAALRRSGADMQRYGGQLDAWQGRQARSAANVRALGTILSGGTTMFAKYG